MKDETTPVTPATAAPAAKAARKTTEELLATRDQMLTKLQDIDRETLRKNPNAPEDFIAAIENVIKEADPLGTEPLIAYVREIQGKSREVAARLRAIVGEKVTDALPLLAEEKTVLRAWAQNPNFVEDTFRKLQGLLATADDKAVVSGWLNEPTEQERSFLVTGALIALDVDGGLHLAVNFYRAILAGISWSKLASALRVVQVYCGLPAFTAASRTFKVLADERITANQATPAGMIEVLRQRFGLNL